MIVESLKTNQFIIWGEGCNYFQSYDSIIGKYEKGTISLSDKWDYSATTLRYLKKWLTHNGYRDMSKSDIQKNINTHEFKLEELN